jgi:hypothetical protein
MTFEIGDRVKWRNHEMWLKSIEGSLGTIIDTSECTITVQWDSGISKPMAYHESMTMYLAKEMYCWDFQERIKDRMS